MRSKLTDAHRNSPDQDDEKEKKKHINAMDFIALSDEKKNYIESSRNIFDRGIEAMNDFISILDKIPKSKETSPEQQK